MSIDTQQHREAATRLAQDFIETTTEYDFTEVPEPGRTTLVDWCEGFLAWSGTTGVPAARRKPGTASPEVARHYARYARKQIQHASEIRCPECRDHKHGNCDGQAWDDAADEATECRCSCRPKGA